MQVQNDDDLHGSQGSNGVKYRKLCSMVTKLGQKITDDDNDLHNRSKVNRDQM